MPESRDVHRCSFSGISLRPQCRHIFVIGMVSSMWSAGAVGQVADEGPPAPPEAGAEIGAATEPAAVEPVNA
jgi:hypothetical protein